MGKYACVRVETLPSVLPFSLVLDSQRSKDKKETKEKRGSCACENIRCIGRDSGEWLGKLLGLEMPIANFPTFPVQEADLKRTGRGLPI